MAKSEEVKKLKEKGVKFLFNIGGDTIIEGRVEELSPSESCVKIGQSWYHTGEVSIIEELLQ